jgi:hypothetical protein
MSEEPDKEVDIRKDILLHIVQSKWFNVVVFAIVLFLAVMVGITYYKVIWMKPCEICEVYHGMMCTRIQIPYIKMP